MRKTFQLCTSILLIFAFVVSVIPCGPSYVTPLFTITSAPENPYLNYAAGRVGIVKPEFHRSVLFAAYRWINGSGLNGDEQKAMIDVWDADFNNKDYIVDDVTEAVKAWTEKRRDVTGKEEKVPDIYVERAYGGYDFFPNCTKNAFETATETLSSRIASHGSDNKNVKNWLAAQDAVFSNCSSGKQTPPAAEPGAPEWLQKDRAYQIAAASFYSLDYDDAKKRFAEIALDSDSVWQETADYLVARTLIRQASLTKNEKKTAEYYTEAEQHLKRFSSSSGKFSDSAERLLGLVKYRLYPQERVRELAQKLSIAGGNANFRQDMIDFTWLMDKFEKQALDEEEKKKEKEKPPQNANVTIIHNSATNTNTVLQDTVPLPSNAPSSNAMNAADNAINVAANTAANGSNFRSTTVPRANESDLEITIYSADYSDSWKFYVPLNATDDQAIAAAEKVVGAPLTDEMKKRVREARQSAYSSRFSDTRGKDYEGGYYGEEKASLSILPEFLRYEDLTDWLFTYQIGDNEAYLYSLKKYRETTSDIWLMTALSKATKSSTELPRLLDAANRSSRSSLAYPTIAYNAARICLEQGKNAEARKIIDEALNSGVDMPVSSVNDFMKLRQKLAETLDDFLKYSLRKPFAFDYGGSVGTIEEFIAEQKTWYNPEYNKEGKEAYDREVEKQFEKERLWQDRLMIDGDTINIMNQFFPNSLLAAVERNEILPEYLRERFATAVWTRAVLLDNFITANKIAPQVLKYHPELELQMKAVTSAAGPIGRQNAVLFMIVKNPMLTPFLEDGLGKTDNEVDQWDTNDYWCEQYDEVYDEGLGDMVPRTDIVKPKFLSAALVQIATAERTKLKKIGDAPKYLGEKVLAWARRSPNDPRLPEALYLMFQANGWTKYGCGSNSELQEQIGELLKTRYQNSTWAQKLISDEEKEK